MGLCFQTKYIFVYINMHLLRHLLSLDNIRLRCVFSSCVGATVGVEVVMTDLNRKYRSEVPRLWAEEQK